MHFQKFIIIMKKLKHRFKWNQYILFVRKLDIRKSLRNTMTIKHVLF